MVWFGDIDIPWITAKDTSISKEIVEKNFVDRPAEVFEKTENLENGTYTLILNEDTHERNETFSEQIDAVESLPTRHGTELPFNLLGDKGHIIVQQSTTSITPSQKFREAEVGLRFLEAEDYKPGYITEAKPFNEEYDLRPVNSVVPIPDTASSVLDSSGSISKEYDVDTEDGKIELYSYGDSSDVIEFNRPSDYTSGERIAPCRLYDSNGERIYSNDNHVPIGSNISNSYIDVTFNNSNISFSVYDVFDGWIEIGKLDFSASDAYPSINTNLEVEVDFINSYTASVLRGHPVVEVNFTGRNKVKFTSSNSLTFNEEVNNYILSSDDTYSKDVILASSSKDGDFNEDSSTLSLNNLDSSKEYTVWCGIVPTRTFPPDFSSYLYNRGTVKRTFVQK